jgi:UDPglucose--hexose-1-phosphate uridylyltransferase
VTAGAPADRRVDPLTGAEVRVVAARQDRPNQPRTDQCPFCIGGLEAPEPYEVKSFANRWPPMPEDRCEIVLYTPEHDATFADLGRVGARRVVDLWAERTATLGARDDVAYVLVFENRGPEVGATIPHPHGQIYAYDEVPPVPRTELANDGCPLCAPPPPALVVTEGGGWRVSVPWAADWPFGLLVAPTAHRPDLPSLDDGERDGLADALVDAFGRLDRLFAAPMPYMAWFHQRPTDGGAWPNAHVHLHVAPLYRSPGTIRFVASAEVGGGIFFNPVDPEAAAAALRDA